LGLCFEACRIKACCTVKCRRLKPMSRFGLIIPCGVRLGNWNPSWTCRAFCLELFDLLQHVTQRWRCERGNQFLTDASTTGVPQLGSEK
jgi:hypothetical protein